MKKRIHFLLLTLIVLLSKINDVQSHPHTDSNTATKDSLPAFILKTDKIAYVNPSLIRAKCSEYVTTRQLMLKQKKEIINLFKEKIDSINIIIDSLKAKDTLQKSVKDLLKSSKKLKTELQENKQKKIAEFTQLSAKKEQEFDKQINKYIKIIMVERGYNKVSIINKKNHYKGVDDITEAVTQKINNL